LPENNLSRSHEFSRSTQDQDRSLKLHLGCGERYLPGFLHVDSRKLDHIDVVADIQDLSAFPDNSADMIYHVAVLEHIGRYDTVSTLAEWFRVLKPGGILRSSVPNFEAIVKAYQKWGDMEMLLGPLYGGQTYDENSHYTMFDRAYYTKCLTEAGFTDIEEYDWRDFLPTGYDDFSRAYLPHMDFDNGMLMMLNVDAIKPGKDE
jgi:predicted SAM-dependent methyltransferase